MLIQINCQPVAAMCDAGGGAANRVPNEIPIDDNLQTPVDDNANTPID